MINADNKTEKMKELLKISKPACLAAADYLNKDMIKEKGTKLGWKVIDEREEDSINPYILTFYDLENSATISYREEKLDILNAFYFFILGTDIERVIPKIKAEFEVLEEEALIKACIEESDVLRKGSAIYNLGITYAFKKQSGDISDLIKKMIKDENPNVRLAVVYSMTWFAWTSLENVIYMEKDNNDDRFKYAAEKVMEFLRGGKCFISKNRLDKDFYNGDDSVRKLCEEGYKKEIGSSDGYKKAMELYDEAISIQPQNIKILHSRAVLKNRMEDIRGAISECDKALEIEPSYPEMYLYRGRLKWLMECSLEAVMEDVNTALLLDPRLLKAFYAKDLANCFEEKGNSLYKAKQLERAFEHYKAVFTIDCDRQKLLNNRACKLINNGYIQEALNDLNRALEVKPDYDMAMLTMAEAYVADGEHENAIDWLEKAVMTNPRNEKEIDGYSCYWPLRDNPRYQSLINGETRINNLKKVDVPEFYILEMILLPGGMREVIYAISADIGQIERAMTAHIKGALGFYKLLCYGQNINVYKIKNSRVTSGVNIMPFLKVKVPGMLTASFDESGNPDRRDINGNTLPREWTVKVKKTHKKTGITYDVDKIIKLSEEMWEYCALDEKEETVFLEPYAEKLNASLQNLVINDNTSIEDLIEQVISGERELGYIFEDELCAFDMPIEEFIEMMEKQRVE